ncbi:MAG TPA: L,D-transpeptidase [Chitinophagaceae bacterium]|nr:L,D-transpeptidase [Chitinophagaceae bacterium]
MRLFVFLLLFVLTSPGRMMYAQNRQSDSMRNKQVAYTRFLQEQAERKKQAEARAAKKPGPAVVSYDSKGNRVETPVLKEGRKTTTTTTTTILIPPVLNRPLNPDTINTDSIALKVLKSKNRLQVWYKGKILTAYKCVFGPSYLQQKCMEGDRCTPEGTFTIQTCKDHAKWDKFMLIDYPNEESQQRFEENKRKGLIPSNARIGGLVGIHGIWFNGDNVIDLKHNWTDGCISLKNKDVEELSRLVKPGTTRITIVR